MLRRESAAEDEGVQRAQQQAQKQKQQLQSHQQQQSEDVLPYKIQVPTVSNSQTLCCLQSMVVR
jgi:hypothetical protein